MSLEFVPTPSACLVRKAGDLGYPSGLCALTPAPTIYLRGDPEAVLGNMVAIVGTRTPEAPWRAWTARLATALVRRGFVVCSGFAPGIDRAAHRGALAAGGKTVAVLGEEVFDIRPRGEHEGLAQLVAATLSRGCLVSEIQPGMERPTARQTVVRLLLRNRIIAALSLGVVVAAARERGGAYTTVQWALRLNKPVWTADFGETTPTGNLRLMLGGHEALPSDANAAAESLTLSLSSSPLGHGR